MPKLLYVTNQICGPGGLERVLAIKTNCLIEEFNYSIHIITLNQPKDTPLFYNFNENIQLHNVTVAGNPIHYFLSYKKAIKSIVNTVGPDVLIVCDDGLKGLLLPRLISGINCPTVYERHVSKNIVLKEDNPSLLQKIKAWFTFKLMDYGASGYDKFVVLTNGNKNEWGLKNLNVIPNPLSFNTKEESTLTNKKIIAVGKQSFQKGYDRLLKSWEIIIKDHSDWTLEIYGALDKSLGLEELAKELKVSEQVTFFPPTKDIANKYKEASIYVMSSRYEGFGMVLTEAMTYGVPCVSFDCPYGPSDIIENNVNGILVENNNIEALANGILFLINNEAARKEMGGKAKESTVRYLPVKIASKWDDLFKNLISSS